MIDRSVLLPYVEELKGVINKEYLNSGKVIELLQPGEQKLNILDLDVDNMLIIIENGINKIVDAVNADEMTSDIISWVEEMLETDVITFKRYCKRIDSLKQLSVKYSEEYIDVLIRLYTSMAIQITNSYMKVIKNNKDESVFISVGGLNLE